MEDVLQKRESYNNRTIPYDNEPTVSITSVLIEGCDCYWYTPEYSSPDSLVIYVHGGGFAMGSVGSHGRMVSHLAKELRTKTLFVEYALAPENPFPAGLYDVVAVYKEVFRHYPGYRITLIGDSAGASLIISAVGEMVKTHFPMPAAVVLMSPWFSLACDYPSYEANALLDKSLNRPMLQELALAYTGNLPIEVSSPNRTLLTRFPPVLIMVGTHEILLDDSKHFYNEIKLIQRKSRLSIYEHQPHNWMKKDIYKEASRRALAEIAEFIQS